MSDLQNNIEKLETYLARFRETGVLNQIGGNVVVPAVLVAEWFVRVARAIAVDIARGRLKPGQRLPGTRTLAASLGVNRNTVVAAYEELAADVPLRTPRLYYGKFDRDRGRRRDGRRLGGRIGRGRRRAGGRGMRQPRAPLRWRG